MARAFLLVAVLAAVALATTAYLQSGGGGHPSPAQAEGRHAGALLRNATGDVVGEAKFNGVENSSVVRVSVSVHDLAPGFHGFHVHETGTCTAPSFTSAGFHLDLSGTGSGGTAHPNEAGDMPVLLVNADGTAEARFTTDRYQIADLLEGNGTALIVHAGRDNYANIPTRYGDPVAVAGVAGSGVDIIRDGTVTDLATRNTGDAGARSACGVIEEN